LTSIPSHMPRTIRLDASDDATFPKAASQGEWAVSGAFTFSDAPEEEITGKWLQAFRNGFLGTTSFGWSSFVSVAPVSGLQYEQIVSRLSHHFVEHYGAPDLAHALPVARKEAEFAASLCAGFAMNTLITVERTMTPEGVKESFRRVKDGRENMHAHIWTLEAE